MATVTTSSSIAATTGTPEYNGAATLVFKDTTVTAWELASTTGVAVVDSTTLSWRHQGITLDNGVAISVGFDGLEDSTTTESYKQLTVKSGTTFIGAPPYVSHATSNSSTPSRLPSSHLTNTGSSTVITTTKPHHTPSLITTKTTVPSTSTAGAATRTTTSSSSSSSGVAPTCTIGAGKAVALVGAICGLVFCGL